MYYVLYICMYVYSTTNLHLLYFTYYIQLNLIYRTWNVLRSDCLIWNWAIDEDGGLAGVKMNTCLSDMARHNKLRLVWNFGSVQLTNLFCLWIAHVTNPQAHRDTHNHMHDARRWRIEHAAESISSSISLCFVWTAFVYTLFVIIVSVKCKLLFVAKLQTFGDCAHRLRDWETHTQAESATSRKRCSYKTNSKLSHWRTQ